MCLQDWLENLKNIETDVAYKDRMLFRFYENDEKLEEQFKNNTSCSLADAGSG